MVVVGVNIIWVLKGARCRSLIRHCYPEYLDYLVSAATCETIHSLLSSFFIPEDEDVGFITWIKWVVGNRKLREDMRN